MKITSLQNFIDQMLKTVENRRQLSSKYLVNKEVDFDALQQLIAVYHGIEQIPNQNGWKLLTLSEGESSRVNVDYETEELKKDIWFFEKGENQFIKHLSELHSAYWQEVNDGIEFLDSIKFRNFITDRDGTINNYCGRYSTSVQSAYNAIFVSRFTTLIKNKPIILTSAPLQNSGIIDISVNPQDLFIYAGSKGREFRAADGAIISYPIEKEKQEMLDTLNARLSELTKQKEYKDFKRIGSGLQFKFGQTTMARQDIQQSIESERSESFLQEVESLVQKIDPDGRYFRIEDTGLDIEIILTIDRNGSAKDFDKGDGILFINEQQNLGIEKGPNLICGDTASDIAMVKASVQQSKETYTIFVTKDEELKRQVRQACSNTFFVSEPDILLSILNKKTLS
ncbi:MAG: hypothetical protein K9G58_01665 [Bacteroidales bacterium]|nr:hypothetical protein [Bacteroidales bacterium]MCF8396844.1 hypothetical protein [Bacteroidales bacterium]